MTKLHSLIYYWGLLVLSLTITKAQIAEPLPSEDDNLVKQLLAENLGTRSFLFSQVIRSSTGHQVIPFQTNHKTHADTATLIQKVIEETITSLNLPTSPTKKLSRINEASRYFEDLLLKKLNAHPDFNCSVPKNTQGREQRTGYPDLKILHKASKTVFYLDPKLFEKKSRASSLRTFYYEPKIRTLKIHNDAVHLLLGISHDGKDGDWTFLNWELVDLSNFKVRLKAEFQASNRDIYRKSNIISSGKTKP